jgi:hypothetical protein
MQEHGRPGWYSWLIVVLTPILAATGVLIISLKVNERTIEDSIARERAARQQTEQAFCGIIVLLDDSYSRSAPVTPAGKELAVAVRRARVDYRCPPG